MLLQSHAAQEEAIPTRNGAQTVRQMLLTHVPIEGWGLTGTALHLRDGWPALSPRGTASMQ